MVREEDRGLIKSTRRKRGRERGAGIDALRYELRRETMTNCLMWLASRPLCSDIKRKSADRWKLLRSPAILPCHFLFSSTLNQPLSFLSSLGSQPSQPSSAHTRPALSHWRYLPGVQLSKPSTSRWPDWNHGKVLGVINHRLCLFGFRNSRICRVYQPNRTQVLL